MHPFEVSFLAEPDQLRLSGCHNFLRFTNEDGFSACATNPTVEFSVASNDRSRATMPRRGTLAPDDSCHDKGFTILCQFNCALHDAHSLYGAL
jgi:hypothetical protein